MQKKDILIIDDDKDLAMITRDALEDHKYTVEIVESILKAESILVDTKFKLIILDINLPDGTGFSFCQNIREKSIVPIIIISARVSDNDKITGLDLGADDYISKPYSLKVLLSRVDANIRRAYGLFDKESKFTFGNIKVNFSSHVVEKKDVQVNLSIKEFSLLKFIIENKNVMLTKEKIFSEVWGIYNECEISTLAVHIRWLREKLEDNPSKPKYIKTIWGKGYMFEVDDEE